MIRTSALAMLAALILLPAVGCSSAQNYQAINLRQNLTPQTLQRYEREYERAVSSGQHDGHGPVTLEYTNWWHLGMLGYYRRGTVMRVPNRNGPGYKYHVMSGHGIGPFSTLYSLNNSATYDSDGRRLSGNRITSWALGYLAITHSSDSLLANGERERIQSMHLFYNMLATHKMNGHMYLSLFTIPNPAGGAVGHGY